MIKNQMNRNSRPGSARLGSPPPPPPPLPRSGSTSPALRSSLRMPPPPPPLSVSPPSSPSLPSSTTPHPPTPPPSPVTPKLPAPATPSVPSAPVVSVKKCPIDPTYKKYFKLKKMRMPIENLKLKIQNDGLDPSIIDQDEPEWDPEPSDTSINIPPPAPSKPQPPSIPEPEPEPEDPYTPPVREKSTPSVPLRQLYWSTVTGRALKDTVWESMADKRQSLDTNEIEELFEVKKQQTVNTSHPAPTTVEEETVSFVDGKRETNIGIGLRKLRYSGEEVKRFLLKIDTFSLSTEALMVMAEIMPKEEECSVIRSYQGDVEKLSFVNAFLYSVAEVPNCADRVNCLLIRSTFGEEKERIKQSLNDFMNDCKIVLENNHFLYLLDYILEIGNYLNGTTSRGGACGYHLDILPQLERTKTSDNCMTLVE